jgi:hypothetical protein
VAGEGSENRAADSNSRLKEQMKKLDDMELHDDNDARETSYHK